jgi:hypothetical protein
LDRPARDGSWQHDLQHRNNKLLKMAAIKARLKTRQTSMRMAMFSGNPTLL